MNRDIFVKSLYKISVEMTSKRMIESLSSPSSAENKKFSNAASWFAKLGDDEKEMLHYLIMYSARFSLFNTLCVLDGVAVIEGGSNKTNFVLYAEKNGKRVLLADENSNNEYLHDILNSMDG